MLKPRLKESLTHENGPSNTKTSPKASSEKSPDEGELSPMPMVNCPPPEPEEVEVVAHGDVLEADYQENPSNLDEMSERLAREVLAESISSGVRLDTPVIVEARRRGDGHIHGLARASGVLCDA